MSFKWLKSINLSSYLGSNNNNNNTNNVSLFTTKSILIGTSIGFSFLFMFYLRRKKKQLKSLHELNVPLPSAPDYFDNPRIRRKILSNIKHEKDPNVKIVEGYKENKDGYLFFWRCFIPKKKFNSNKDFNLDIPIVNKIDSQIREQQNSSINDNDEKINENFEDNNYTSDSDSSNISELSYKSDKKYCKNAKAMLCLIYGFSGHLEWHNYEFCTALCKLGYMVFSYDLRGHGRSDGKYMEINNFELMVEDSCQLFKYAKKRFGNKDLDYFLLGESMGGCLALHVSLKQDYRNVLKLKSVSKQDKLRWNGVILLSPMIEIEKHVRPNYFVELFARYFLVPLFPSSRPIQTNELKNHLTKDSKYVNFMDKNPLNNNLPHRLVTGMTLIDICDYTKNILHDVKIPLLILHGKNDKITNCDMSKELYKLSGSKDKKLIIYQNSWHMVFADLDKKKAYNDINKWMTDRLGDNFRNSSMQLLTYDEKKKLQLTIDFV